MCYYYDGDGVCEDFEQETGVRDCGLYTPNGFLDQWAATVQVSHEQKPYCSGEVAAGYPAVTKVRFAQHSYQTLHLFYLIELIYSIRILLKENKYLSINIGGFS